MFEYLLPNGTALPEDEVRTLALQKGLTTDEYVKKQGLKLRPKQKKKTEPTASKTKPTQKEVDKAWGTQKSGTTSAFYDEEQEAPVKKASAKQNTPYINIEKISGVTDFGANLESEGEPFDFSKAGQSEEYKTESVKKNEEAIALKKKEQRVTEQRWARSEENLDIENSIKNPDVLQKKELKGNDSQVVANLNKKYGRLGLEFKEFVVGGGLEVRPIGYKPNADKSNLDVPMNFNIDDEDAYQRLQDYISQYKVDDYAQSVKQQLGPEYSKFRKSITPTEFNNEALTTEWKKNLDSSFRNAIAEKNKYKGEVAATGLGAEPEEYDFKTPLEFKRYKEWRKTGVVPEPSRGELMMYDASRKKDYTEKAAAKYASSLSKDERKAFEILTNEYQREGVVKKYNLKSDVNTFNEASKLFEKNKQDYKKNPTEEGLALLKRNQIDLLNKQNYLQDEILGIEKYDKENKNFLAPAITNFSANYNSLEELVTNFKQLGTSVALSISETAGNIITGVDEVAGVDELGQDYTEMDAFRKRDVFGVYELAKELRKEKETYQKAIGVEDINSVTDAGRWLVSSAVNAVPSLSMALTGPAALPLFFLSGYGGKADQFMANEEEALARLKENMDAIDASTDPTEQSQLQKQINKDKEILGIPEWKKLTSGVLAGAAEVIFEKLGTMPLIKGVSQGMKQLPKKSLKEGAEWAAKNMVKSFNKEGLSEVATTAMNNLTDILLLNENKNWFDGFTETYAQGGLVGGGLASLPSGSVVKQAYRSEVASKKEQREMSDIVNKIAKITGVPGYALNQKLPLGRLTNEVQGLVDKLTARKENIYEGIDDRLSKGLTLDQLKTVGDINRQIRDINKDFRAVASNPDVAPAQLKEIQDEYRKEFNELIEKKEVILNDPIIKETNGKIATARNVKFDSTLGYKTYSSRMASESLQGVVNDFSALGFKEKLALQLKAKEEFTKEGKENVSEKELLEKTRLDWVTNVYKGKINKGIENSKLHAVNEGIEVDFDVLEGTPSENIKRLEASYLASDEYQSNTPTERKETLADIKSGDVDAQKLTIDGRSKIVIDLNKSAEGLRTGIGSHELLHVIVDKGLKSDKATAQQGEKLLSYIQNKDADLYALVKERLDSSYAKKNKKGERVYDENGELIKDSSYNIEVLNAVSDLAADGRKLKPDTLNQLRSFVNKYLKEDLQFKESEGADVYQFVRNFNKTAHFGGKNKYNIDQLSGKFSDEDEEGAKPAVTGPKSSKTKIEELKEQLAALEEEYDEGYGDMEEGDYKNTKSNLETKIKAETKLAAKAEPTTVVEKPKKEVSEESSVKEIIKENKGKISSDKVQEIYDKKGAEGSLEIMKLFKPITARIVDKRRDAPGFSEPDLTYEIENGKGGILDLIMKYDPEEGVPLAAYINKYLPVRAITASRRILDKEFTSDVSEEVNVAATETADQNMTERVAEKPTYKNALESKVLAPDVLETANKKILPIVRTLKSRIDAPVTLNRTVTPLIAEIRDEIGKQLDIDIKTMLGGKKDGVFRKELLRTKRYILENMTTTWLMGKDGQGGIPQAIQKKVNGQWVSFPTWVGQKIDRETMSTDLAGRTSGAELVRRIPNVFNNVSDVDFLGQFIGPDGNPIRGRKESGSKAMAEEIAFDVILNDFKLQGPIFQAFAANQERLGVQINDVLTTTFTNQVERGNVKFSKAGTTNSMLFLLKENQWDFNSPELIAFYKSLGDKDKINYADFKKEWRRKVANLPEEYKRVWESNEGVKFEAETYTKLRNFSKNNPEFILNERIPDKFNSKNPDLVYKIGKDGRAIIAELKSDKYAPHGSTSNVNILGKNISLTKGFDGDADFKEAMLNSEIRKATLDYLIKNNISKNPNSLIVTKEVWDNVKKEKNGPSKPITSKALGQINAGKDVIHIQGSGSFTYKGRNVGQLLNVPEIEGNMYVYSRITSISAGKNGDNRRVIERLFFQLGNDWDQKSDYDIVNDPSKFVKDTTKFSKAESLITSEYWEKATQNNININAVSTSSKLSKTAKGISVFDFDDTVGLTKGSVLYTMPDGSKGKLNAEEFAKDGSILLENGAEFDFSEFSKVVGGKPGPMVEKMKKMIGKFGPDNFFILTARPANAAGPIHEFLSSIGIDIPLENITGLGNSTAQAKANWMTGKATEGYNDFYFSDDAIQNVKAVKDALDVLDVKSKIQQARLKFSKSLNSRFNDILQENVGLDPNENFSDILAKRKGTAIGKYRFFVPPSAADFELLLYDFLGRGKIGERQYKFFTKALLEPYSNGIALIDAAKQSIKNDYTALKKAFPDVNKNLGKLTPDGNFTYDQAIRVSMWNSMGVEIPGLDKSDITAMVNFVNNDASLSAYKAGLIATGRQGTGWIEPTEYWDAETIISDLHNITEKLGRKKYLAEFIDNSKEIFTPENLNRIEVIYGSNFREALEDSIYRMTNGTNRESGTNRLNAAWLNWINNSTAAIMFFNTKSALLQTVGSINYLNWRENNPLNAALAFANQPQYWKDFAMIFNSDKIKERRSGLKEDVTSAEIANAAEGSKNKASAVISYLLKKGFMPTQIADSFAIGIGGASFYRNKVNAYLKQGMELDEAGAQAWKDFSKVTDETQQSGDPRDISQQQASTAGRLVLAFQNTPMQQARLIKKSALDLINGRGDAKTHISKIVYYTAVQNIIFGGLQSALFTVLFDDDDDEEDKKKKTAKDKWIEIGNGTVDTLLRGSGLGGAIVATLKNVAKKYFEEKEKGFKADYGKVLIEAANIAPPLGSKFQKAFGAMRTAEFEKDVIKERGWSVTANGKLNLSPSYSVLGQVVEAGTNLPVNRLVTKVNNVSEALDSRNKSWQRIAMGLGYKPYAVGAKNEESDIIKANAKLGRKTVGIQKMKETRTMTRDSLNKLSPEDFKAYVLKKKTERLAVKDSINKLPKAQLDKYLAEKEASKLFTSKQKEVLKEIKRDSINNLSESEFENYLEALRKETEIKRINRILAKEEKEKKRNIYK
jgi:hypothetical protein